MARKLMARYECSRCTREWYEEFQKGKEPLEPPSFRMKLTVPNEPDVEVAYAELCKSCMKTVSNYAHNIAKQLTHKSPRRAKKEEAEASPDENERPTRPLVPSKDLGRTSSAGSTAE